VNNIITGSARNRIYFRTAENNILTCPGFDIKKNFIGVAINNVISGPGIDGPAYRVGIIILSRVVIFGFFVLAIEFVILPVFLLFILILLIIFITIRAGFIFAPGVALFIISCVGIVCVFLT
jgi:hypothetical protein